MKSRLVRVRVYPCPEEELIMIPIIIIAWIVLERIDGVKFARKPRFVKTGEYVGKRRGSESALLEVQIIQGYNHE